MMVHKEGGRIQELEVEIKKELERLGITGVNFYFRDSENSPRVEYKIEDRRDIKCRELKTSLRKIITSNIMEIRDINWKYDDEKGVYVGELELFLGFRIDSDMSRQHGVFNLAYTQIVEHKKRYRL